MRIYKGKNSQVNIPITNTMRITIAPHSVSKDFLPNDEFLTIVPTAYTDKDVALIVGGPYEINMCAKAPAAAPLVVQSLDEAIERFTPKSEVKKVVEAYAEKKEEVVEEPVIAPVVEEAPVETVAEKEEEIVPEVEAEEEAPVTEEPVVVEETAEEPVQQQKKNKKNKRK